MTLAPTLFSLYYFLWYRISYHCYADDTQLYIPLKRGDNSAVQIMFRCRNSSLHLNEDKTQIVLFYPNDKTDLNSIDFGSLTPYSVQATKNLGFIFDSGLKFDQINAKVSSSFYHLRRLANQSSIASNLKPCFLFSKQ